MYSVGDKERNNFVRKWIEELKESRQVWVGGGGGGWREREREREKSTSFTSLEMIDTKESSP